MAKYNVLSTKRLDPSLIARACEHDIIITEQEFIKTVPIHSPGKQDEIKRTVLQSAVAFTSANAVAIVYDYLHKLSRSGEHAPHWNIFAISGKTSERVRMTEDVVINSLVSADHAYELAQKIIASDVKELAFFCGNKRRDELPDLLREAGINVHEIIVYETLETPVVTSTKFDALLFFSPSAVQSYFTVNQLNEDAVCFAIGKTTADCVKKYCNNKIMISESPGQEQLMSLVISYFQSINSYK